MKKQKIYLVANYITRPKDPKMTHVAGYMKNPDNYQYDEQVQVSTRVRDKDILSAKIIMNLSDKTVDKNAFNSNKDFNELFKYFFEGYHKYITEVMTKLDPEYLSSMVEQMQSELDATNEKKSDLAE